MPSTDFVYVGDDDGLKRFNKDGVLNDSITDRGDCTAIAVDEYENVYAAFGRSGDTEIAKIDDDFNIIWYQEDISQTVNTIVAVESVGTLYYGTVSAFGDGSIGRIRMYDNPKQPSLQIGGAKLGDLDIPSGGVTGITWDARGYTWLSTETDSNNSENIYCVTADGSIQTSWTVTTSAAADANPTTGIRFDNQQREIYFTDADGVVHKANAENNASSYPGDNWTGSYTASSPLSGHSTNLERDYYAFTNDGIARLNQDGSTQWTTSIGESVRDVSVDYDYTSYVLTQGVFDSEEVHKIAPDGSITTTFTVANEAYDIAVYQEFDSDPYSWRRNNVGGNNFVHAFTTDDIVAQFDRSGNVVRTVDVSPDVEDGRMSIDGNGVLYVRGPDNYLHAYDNKFNFLWRDGRGTDSWYFYSGICHNEKYGATFALDSSDFGRLGKFKSRDGYNDEYVSTTTDVGNDTGRHLAHWSNDLLDPRAVVVKYESGVKEYEPLELSSTSTGGYNSSDVLWDDMKGKIDAFAALHDGYIFNPKEEFYYNTTQEDINYRDVDGDENAKDFDNTGGWVTGGNELEYYDSSGSLNWASSITNYGSVVERGVIAYPQQGGHPEFWQSVQTRSEDFTTTATTTDSEVIIPTESTSELVSVPSTITITDEEPQTVSTSVLTDTTTQILVSETLIQADTQSAFVFPDTQETAQVTANSNTSTITTAPDVFINISDSLNEALTVSVSQLSPVSATTTESRKEILTDGTKITPVVTITNTVSEQGITSNSVLTSAAGQANISAATTSTFADSEDNLRNVTVKPTVATADSSTVSVSQDVAVTTTDLDELAESLTTAQLVAVTSSVFAEAFPGDIAVSEENVVQAALTQTEQRFDITVDPIQTSASATPTVTTYETEFDTVSELVIRPVETTETVALRSGIASDNQVITESVSARIYSRVTISGVNEQRTQTYGDYNVFAEDV